jgi:hypothetical protein
MPLTERCFFEKTGPTRFDRWTKAFRLVATVLLVFSSANCKPAAPTNSDQPAAPPAVDQREAYCLILQARLLAVRSLLSESQSEITEYRDETSRVLAALRLDRGFSTIRLPELYKEVVALIDAYDAYTTGIDQLSRSLKQREKTDADAAERKAVIDAFKEAGSTDAEKDDSTLMTTLKRGVLGGITGIQSYAAEEKRLKEIREQDKEGRLAACENKYAKAKSDFAANTKALAGVLGRDLRIAQGELGLDTLLANVEFYRRESPEAIAKARKGWRRERPNDPVLHAVSLQDSGSDTETVETLLKLADESNNLAETVPNRSELNYVRHTILITAASIVETYFDKAYPFAGAWGSAHNDKALIAASYRERADTAYSDSAGDNVARLAWDYFLAGDFDKALAAAERAPTAANFKLTPGFCFKLAQLNSLVGKADQSFHWVTLLIDTFHYAGIKELYADQDLVFLRNDKRKAFDELLALDYDWKIEFGLLNDDILFTNKSRYPLTNVRLRPHIESGAKEWDLNLRADVVSAGETVKWTDVLSVPGSRTSSETTTMACDQSR